MRQRQPHSQPVEWRTRFTERIQLLLLESVTIFADLSLFAGSLVLVAFLVGVLTIIATIGVAVFHVAAWVLSF